MTVFSGSGKRGGWWVDIQPSFLCLLLLLLSDTLPTYLTPLFGFLRSERSVSVIVTVSDNRRKARIVQSPVNWLATSEKGRA